MKKLCKNSRNIGGEVPQTGALINALHGEFSESDEWNVRIYFQGFNSNLKEPIVEADMGIVVTVTANDRTMAKAALAQAKKGSSVENTFTDPNLREQFDKMRKITESCYGVAYSPTEVGVFADEGFTERLTMSQLITDMARCSKGDREKSAIAEALEKDNVVESHIRRKGSGTRGKSMRIRI